MFQDELSKFIVATPLLQQGAEIVAKALVLNITLNLVHLPKF
jgi:hypothetical protein